MNPHHSPTVALGATVPRKTWIWLAEWAGAAVLFVLCPAGLLQRLWPSRRGGLWRGRWGPRASWVLWPRACPVALLQVRSWVWPRREPVSGGAPLASRGCDQGHGPLPESGGPVLSPFRVLPPPGCVLMLPGCGAPRWDGPAVAFQTVSEAALPPRRTEVPVGAGRPVPSPAVAARECWATAVGHREPAALVGSAGTWL